MPWLHYVRKNITGEVKSGKNLLAIEVTHYVSRNQRAQPGNGQSPMSATVYIEMTDGSVEVFATGRQGWKSALNATGEWFTPRFDDSSWAEAEAYVPPSSNFGVTKLGKPWNTGPVEILRRSFQVDKPAKSVRLYATALGAYKFHVNGKPVSDQILAPGWTDFRQHVAYQVYDVTADITTGKRSEEHTSELQSQSNLVCRLLLEKKKKNKTITYSYHKVTSHNSDIHTYT